MSKTLLQINVSANWGSTGRIAEQINQIAQQQGWNTFIAYGRSSNESKSELIQVGSKWQVYEHYFEHLLFDNDGLASRHATRQLVRKIRDIQPDIIHLHNIHDHWINYELLFEYLSTVSVPVIWTQHDCWSFTGGCKYYSSVNCKNWQNGCSKCPFKERALFPIVEKTRRHFNKKRHLFTSVANLTLVPVSHWLEVEIQKSFLGGNRVHTIYNGINTDIFHPQESDIKSKYNIRNKHLLLGIASTWEPRKGLSDYVRLSEYLPDDTVILLVGLDKKHINNIPSGIIGLRRTQNVEELVKIYSAADIVLNLSHEETFGLTTVEGFACGTPSIVYNATASPELVTLETGIVVEPGDIQGVANAVAEILGNGKEYYSEACRKRAVEFYDKDKCFKKYFELYERLINV